MILCVRSACQHRLATQREQAAAATQASLLSRLHEEAATGIAAIL